MNLRYLASLFFWIISLSIGFAQSNILGLKAGSRLTYDVVGALPGNGKTFTVTIKSISDGEVVYEWERLNNKGSVTLKTGAIADARRIHNAYAKPSKQVLTDRTSIFLSRKVFQELELQGKADVLINGMKTPTKFDRFMERDYDILVNGKLVSYKALLNVNQEQKDKPRVVMTLKDPTFPLIVGMDLDFRIALKAVDNP